MSTADVRKLMEMPLRGELTKPVAISGSVSSALDGVQSVMAQLLRLSTNTAAALPYPPLGTAVPSMTSPSQSIGDKAKDVTASWHLTASDAASTEIAILPYLIHLAVAKADVYALRFCIDAADAAAADANIKATSPLGDPVSSFTIGAGAAGIVNALDTSGRAPLHTAALHGNAACTKILLESGASVHLRDALDHTPLYYVSGRGDKRATESV